MVLTKNDEEYYQFSAYYGWVTLYINNQKIQDGKFFYSIQPDFNTFNLIIGHFQTYQAFTANYGYFAVTFGYSYSTGILSNTILYIEFYYNCFDLCDISLGISCMCMIIIHYFNFSML